MQQSVYIVIVNYNDLDYLHDFMRSVEGQTYKNIQVIMVDNASVDDSVKWMETNCSKVHIIKQSENTGFGAGCNIGMEYAIKQGAEYVLLLNTDTILEKNLVEELIRYADDKTVVTGQITCGDGTDIWYSGGRIDKEKGITEQNLYGIDVQKEYYEVEFISGCCMMISKNIIERVGGFDETFFLYYEDTEYCIRLKQAGVRLLYIPKARLWHKVGGSSSGNSENSCSTEYYVARNRLLFAERCQMIRNSCTVLKEILQERAFFTGIVNERYRVYTKAAIADYMHGYFGKGYYGKQLLEEHYYIESGICDKERNSERNWHYVSSADADLFVTNPERTHVIYQIDFDIGQANAYSDEHLEVYVEGKYYDSYSFPSHLDFQVLVPQEGKVKIHLSLRGERFAENIRGDGTLLPALYQIFDLSIRKSDRRVIMGKGFYQTETDGRRVWNWAKQKETEITIVLPEKTKNGGNISFLLETDEQYREEQVLLYWDDVKQERKRYFEKIVKSFTGESPIHKLRIVSAHESYYVPGDSRALNFQIKNLVVE